MADTYIFADPPRSPFRWLNHPFLLLFLAILLYWLGTSVYHHFKPRPVVPPSPTKPDGEWVGEVTMDGRYWFPTIEGDTPGPHRHGVLRFTLDTTDAFMDHHAGPGQLKIVGEGITRPLRAFGWEPDPDGTLRFEILASPTIFSDKFNCTADGSTLTCKSTDHLKPHLLLHPGTDADADALYRKIEQQAATEPPLPALQIDRDDESTTPPTQTHRRPHITAHK